MTLMHQKISMSDIMIEDGKRDQFEKLLPIRTSDELLKLEDQLGEKDFRVQMVRFKSNHLSYNFIK